MCPSYPCVWPELNHIDHLLNLAFNNSLDAFQSYYLNKYADHHMHETVFDILIYFAWLFLIQIVIYFMLYWYFYMFTWLLTWDSLVVLYLLVHLLGIAWWIYSHLDLCRTTLLLLVQFFCILSSTWGCCAHSASLWVVWGFDFTRDIIYHWEISFILLSSMTKQN